MPDGHERSGDRPPRTVDKASRPRSDPSSRRPAVFSSFERHPLRLVGQWARHVAAGELAEALSLYAPDAVISLDGEVLKGHRHISGLVESMRVFDRGVLPKLRMDGEAVIASWEPTRASETALGVRSRVHDGLIAEQWIGKASPQTVATVPLESEGLGPEVAMTILTRDQADEDDVAYVRHRVARLMAGSQVPVLHARVKLAVTAHRSLERPATAQGSLDLGGRVLRGHVAAHSLTEAIDLLVDRLSYKLEHEYERTRVLKRHAAHEPPPGEWRHGDLPAHRPSYFDRPVEERQLVRHKAFAASEETVDEAVLDLDQLDYGFHLFHDLDSGQDCLLERLEDGSLRLQRAHRSSPQPTSVHRFELSELPAPELTLEAAIERLDAGAEHFIFFTTGPGSRGAVLYRRYDGHYGLITLE